MPSGSPAASGPARRRRRAPLPSRPSSLREGGPDAAPTKRARSAWERSTLSYSGRKRGGAGVSGSGRGASGRSKSSRPRSSRNVSSCGRNRSTTSRSPVRRDQRRRVGDRRRPERPEVAEDDVVERRRGGQRPAEPGFGCRPGDPGTPAPESARRRLDEGKPHLARVDERCGIEPGEPLGEDRSQLGPVPRPLGQHRPAELDDRLEVELAERRRVVAVAPELAFEDRLHQRAQEQAVARP